MHCCKPWRTPRPRAASLLCRSYTSASDSYLMMAIPVGGVRKEFSATSHDRLIVREAPRMRSGDLNGNLEQLLRESLIAPQILNDLTNGKEKGELCDGMNEGESSPHKPARQSI